MALMLGASLDANAFRIAVFGDNATDNYLASIGNTVTLVTDAQLATAGFLNSFDLVWITRDGSNFGAGLSAAAAARVVAYVGGASVVLLSGDFADGVSTDSYIQTLFSNAANVAGRSGHGYVGEFNGAAMALTANGDGFTPLGLISGIAGALLGSNGGAMGTIVLTPGGLTSPVTAGLANNFNPASVEFGPTITGVANQYILANYSGGGSPAIIAQIPEPATLALVGLGLAGLGFSRRKR